MVAPVWRTTTGTSTAAAIRSVSADTQDSITGGATKPSLNRRRIRESKPPLEFGLALTRDSGMKPIAVFRHSPGEGPGYFATFLDHHSLPWTLFRIDDGVVPPPTADAFS